jgi:hypothetical protein
MNEIVSIGAVSQSRDFRQQVRERLIAKSEEAPEELPGLFYYRY